MSKAEELYKGLRSGSINKSQLSEQQIGDVYKYMLDKNKVSASQFKPEVAQKYNLVPQQSSSPQSQLMDIQKINNQPIVPTKAKPFMGYPMNVEISKPKSTTPEMELVDVISNITMPKNNIELYQRGQDKLGYVPNDENPSLLQRIDHGLSSIGKTSLGSGLSALGTTTEYLSNPWEWTPDYQIEIQKINSEIMPGSKPLIDYEQELEQSRQNRTEQLKKAQELGLPNTLDLTEKSDELLQSAEEDRQKGKQGLGKGGSIAYDILVAAGQMGADIGTAAFTGVGLMPVLGARVFGQSASEARQSGAELNQQIEYGALSAGIEIATEKIVGGIPLAEKLGAGGVADNTIKKMAQGIAKSPKLSTALTYVANMAGEGAEEAIAEILSPVAKRLTYDPNADWASMEEILYSALIGAGVSGIMGGGVYFQGDNNQTQTTIEPQEQISQGEAITPTQTNDNTILEQSVNADSINAPMTNIDITESVKDVDVQPIEGIKEIRTANQQIEPTTTEQIKDIQSTEANKNTVDNQLNDDNIDTSERLRQDFDIPDTQISEAVVLAEKISKEITENNQVETKALTKLVSIINETHPELTAAEIENGLFDVFMDVAERTQSLPINDVVSKQSQQVQLTQQDKLSTGEQAFKGKTNAITGEIDMSRPLKRPSEIKKNISKQFNIPLSSKKYNKRKAVGFYKVMPEVIRTKYDNDLGTVAHELGHHFDKKYKFSNNNPNLIKSMINKMSDDFKKSYSESEYAGEAVAEFLRYYLTDTKTAKDFSKDFYNTFEQSLDAKDLKSIQEIRADVLRWVNGEWMEKAKKTMVTADENRKTLKDKISSENANMMFFDVFAPFNRFVNVIEDTTGKKVPPSLNPYLLALQTNKNGGRIDSILRGEMSSPKNKIIFKEDNLQKILNDLDKNTSEFELYLKLKHALTLEDKGHQIFPKDIEVSQERLDAIEQQFPKFKELSERLYKWYDTYFKAWVIDTNMLGPDSKKIYEVMREKYPYYVPMFRVKDGQIKGKNAKSGFNDQKSPVDRLSEKGSDRDTISPIDGIVMQVNRAVNAQTKNNVMRTVIEHYKNVDGLGNFIDRVPPDMEMQMVDAGALKTRIGKNLKDKMTTEDIDNLLSNIEDTIIAYKPLSKSRDKDIIGIINKDGKKEFYQVFDENFLKSMTNMDKVQLDFTVQTIAEIRRTVTALTTGANPMFALTSNTPRDIQHAFLYGSHNNPFEYAKATGGAIINVLKESENFKKFKALGGGYGSSIQGAETKMSKDMRNKLTDFRKGKNSSGRSNLDHVIGMIADMNDWFEAAPRFAEYEKAYKKGMELYKNEYDASIYALHKSDDVTLNFMRRGTIMNTAAGQIIPYFNAGLQGMNKLYRNLVSDPEVRTQTWIKSISMLTIPTILLWMFHRDDEDYKKLSKGIKDNYWILPFKTADGAFVRIPKPKDAATLFSSDFERGLNAIFEKEGVSAFNGYLGTMLDSLAPNTETVFRPIIDIEKNEKWSGGAIVSQGMQGMLKQDQYDDTTSTLALYLGKAIAQVFPESKFASPKAVHYLLDQMGGGVMDILLPLTTPNSYTPMEAIRRKFIADPSYSNNVINEFYELKSATEKANTSFEKKGTITNEIDFIAEEELKAYYKAIDMHWDNINSIGMFTDKQLTQQQTEAFKEIIKRSRYKDTTKDKFNDDLKDKKLSDENIKLLQKSLRDEIVKLADKAIKEYNQYHDISLERFKVRVSK